VSFGLNAFGVAAVMELCQPEAAHVLKSACSLEILLMLGVAGEEKERISVKEKVD
jgi:hypothetical protein